MTIRRLILSFVFATVLFGQTPCRTVTGDQIMSGDLANAVPAFAPIPKNVPLAPSPLPGGTRVFTPAELQSISSRYSISLQGTEEVCFRLAVAAPDRDAMIAAMRGALSNPDVRIDLIEAGPSAVPSGAIEFALENLSAPSLPDRRTPVVWRGDIVYAGNRHFAVWAKVIVTAPVMRLIAVEGLRAGVPVSAKQVRTDVVERFPAAVSNLTSESVAGMLLLRPVAAGAEIRADNLVRPNDVNRGDTVHVEVRIGGARLTLTARAESGGRIGDYVTIRNPETSRTFQALVNGSDRVIVEGSGSE